VTVFSAGSFDWLPDDLEEARFRALDRLRLDGRDPDVRVADALRDVRVERTITGASTVTLDLLDPDGDLLDSDLFQHAVEVRIVLDEERQRLAAGQVGVTVEDDDPLRFTLEALSPSERVLSLTFVDREVALLKQHNKPRKASRKHVTRAEFVRMLVREVKDERIGFWSPELHKRQPVQHERDTKPTSREEAQHKRGLSKSDRIKVQKHPASAAQIRVLETALEAVSTLKGVTKPILVMTVMCTTQETAAQNLGPRVVQGPNGPQTITGAFQQTIGGGWPASRDVARDAIGFAKKLMQVYQRYTGTGKSYGELIDLVQVAGTPKAFEQWRDEATITVNEWSGGTGFASTSGGTKYVKRAEFRRGEQGQRENSWEAMQRLAQEVAWRCFVDRGVVFFVSDNYLRQGRVRMRIKRGDLPEGVEACRVGDHDAARHRGTAELTALVGKWLPPLGGMVELEGYGLASGRYLIEGTSGSLLSPTWTVSLTRPVSALKEPAAERVAVGGTSGGGGGSLGSGVASTSGQLGRFLQWAKSTLGTHTGSGLQRRWAADLGFPASDPWCSIWIAFGVKHYTGLPMPPRAAYSGTWLLDQWRGGRVVHSKSKAVLGDFLIFDWGDGGITDHVGVYLGGGRYISGNYSDMVGIGAVKWNCLVGIVRPDW
jgi:hypothetical protein